MAIVINIKASFKLLESHKLHEDSDQYLFYSAGHLQVLKTGAYTYFIMGEKNRYVNVTAVQKLKN